MFCSSKSLYEIEKIQERVTKSGKATMEIKRLRCLAIELFKTENKLNPYYIKEIFSAATNLTHRPLDINFNQNNTTKYSNNSLRNLGPHICVVKSKGKQSTKNVLYELYERLVCFGMQVQHMHFSQCIKC